MSKNNRKNKFKTFYAISLAWQLGFSIALPIVGFLILGFYLDEKFQVSPLFLIIGIILIMVTTVYEVRHLLLPLMISDYPEVEKNDLSEEEKRD